MRRALSGVEVWMTGLMRSQGGERADIRELQWNDAYQLVQVNPLAGWDRRRVWEYVRSHDVPYNALHERGYPTLGCTHCTVAVADAGPRDYSRAGRWAGMDKTECGLHYGAPGPLSRKA
jgi:phosphoadenosine phosphosulfate reductase